MSVLAPIALTPLVSYIIPNLRISTRARKNNQENCYTLCKKETSSKVAPIQKDISSVDSSQKPHRKQSSQTTVIVVYVNNFSKMPIP